VTSQVGHPARLLPSVVGLSLDARVKQHSHQTELADDVRKEMAKLQSYVPPSELRRTHDYE